MLTGAALLGGGCANSGSSSDKGTGGPNELFAETASFETVKGTPQRITFGLSTVDGRILHGGKVHVTFRPVDSKGSLAKGLETAASYLAVAGSASAAESEAVIGDLSDGIGVYAATANFPSTGYWIAEIRSDKTRKPLAETGFEVKAKNAIPNIGDPAPRTQNPIVVPGRVLTVPINRIDSRSGPDALPDLADPGLHGEVIADLLDAHRPFVVVVSTPAYCQSKFCGPITDVVDERAKRRGATETDLAFVHLEVFADSVAGTVNKWAAEWILGDGEGREPWVFVVGRDGKITARFDNVMTAAELDGALSELKR